ncbi:MAG: putative toxin-antitoxin system toxin component, PIN family [Candidatus Omnitrophota bacterium]|nr:putative toxin-antitoxin system toxin component, PIN family [Candidatus Omnitrophota bacterium]
MKVVIDTNIIVSGFLSPFSPSGEIVRMIASGELELCHDIRVLSEYKEVLLRPKFSFNASHVHDLLSQIESCGYMVAALPLKKSLPDPDDEPFLEIALAGKARCLVTGNMIHYPVSGRHGMTVVSPKEFIEIYKKES